MNISELSVSQLQQAVALKKKIAKLQSRLASLLGNSIANGVHPRRGMSAAGRARIAAAQRARWAKVRGRKSAAANPKRRLSASARKRIAAAAKARWARAKAAGRKRL